MSIWDVNELVSTNVAIYFPLAIQFFYHVLTVSLTMVVILPLELDKI